MKAHSMDYFIFGCIVLFLIFVAGLSTSFCISPLSMRLVGDFHILIDGAMFFLLYGLFSGLLVRLCLQLHPIQWGTYSMDHSHFFYWKFITVIFEFGKFSLRPYTFFITKPLMESLFGAKMGGNIISGGVLIDPWSITVSDNAILGLNSAIISHAITNNRIILNSVIIHKGATVGVNCVIMPGVSVGENSVIAAGSVVKMDTNIPANELWGGTPARKIKDIEFNDIAKMEILNADTLNSRIKRVLEKLFLQLKDKKVAYASVSQNELISCLPIVQAPIVMKSVATKTFLYSFKFYLFLAMVSLAFTVGFYTFKKLNTISSYPTAKKITQIDTNQNWDFINEKDRNIPLLFGEWIWNNQQKAMITRINSFVILSLPIKPQEKPFVVEYVIAPYITSESPESELFFANGWINEKQMLGNEYIKVNNNLKTGNSQIVTVKTYYFKNEVYLFSNNVCIAINKYSLDLIGANVGLMTKNYIFQKITSHTFELPPDELRKAIESNSQKKGEIRYTLKIDPQKILESNLSKQNSQ